MNNILEINANDVMIFIDKRLNSFNLEILLFFNDVFNDSHECQQYFLKL